MIESAVGLVRVEDIASAVGVHQLHVGEVDLAADLGVTPGGSDVEFHYARSRIVVASRFAGIAPPVAPVNTRTDDPSTFSRSTTALARMGFVGRDCIHPAQVAVANDVFEPSRDDVELARRLLRLAEGKRGSFRGPDGSMVDEAVLRRARDLVELDLTYDSAAWASPGTVEGC
jgi:citrate lyase subunit beta/citryl-CoA lyase